MLNITLLKTPQQSNKEQLIHPHQTEVITQLAREQGAGNVWYKQAEDNESSKLTFTAQLALSTRSIHAQL